MNKMQHLVLVLYKEYPETCILYYVVKIIVHAHLNVLLECIIDTWCGQYISHEYCTSNKYLQNIEVRAPPSQLHTCSYIIMIWLQFFNDK